MKINANSIRMGNVLEHENALYVVIKQPEHTMPGKGGAFVQVEMKNLKTGNKTNVRFRSNEDVERVRLEQREMQFLYDEGETIAVMDNESFEQMSLPKSMLGEKAAFLQESMVLSVDMHEENPIMVNLPGNAVLEVAETEPVIKGQTAASSYKPAILSNGVRVMVPPFVDAGEKIVVRIEDATYLERAKN